MKLTFKTNNTQTKAINNINGLGNLNKNHNTPLFQIELKRKGKHSFFGWTFRSGLLPLPEKIVTPIGVEFSVSSFVVLVSKDKDLFFFHLDAIVALDVLTFKGRDN